MKNKKVTYILIATVALVWGIIIFRIVGHFKSPDIPENNYLPINTSDEYFQKDSVYTLKLKYSDPFLKGSYAPVASAEKTTQPTSNKNIGRSQGIRRRVGPNTQAITPQKKTNWPEIVYSGVIINDKTGERLGLVNISNQTFLIRTGESRNNVELVGLYSDSVRVSYQNEMKTIIITE